MKTCTKCKIEKPFEQFNKASKEKDGLTSRCKACIKEYHQEHYKKNKEKIDARNKAWAENNRERRKEYEKRYREENLDRIKEKSQKYYLENKETIDARNREYDRLHPEKAKERAERWERENPERRKQLRDEYYSKEENVERRRERVRNWYSRNSERICEQKKKRYIERGAKEYYQNAHEILRGALKMGILKRPTNCSVCGKGGRIEGHHKDYTKPLEVDWLCKKCHIAEHQKITE